MSSQQEPFQVEYGVFDIPIRLPESMEPQRAELQGHFLEAQRRLKAFAQKYGWLAHVAEPFAREFRLFADKPSFDRSLLELCGLDPSMELPSSYCAALEAGVLVSVSPELYRALYPEGDEENAFEKLLAHEMAHRLHIRILGGDEEAMGAVWFYEGFALFAAGQFEDDVLTLEPQEIWDIVNEPERGSYRRYAAVFQYFAGKAPLQQLVERAGKPDFLPWLKSTGG